MSPNNMVRESTQRMLPPPNSLSDCFIFLCIKMAITLVANRYYCLYFESVSHNIRIIWEEIQGLISYIQTCTKMHNFLRKISKFSGCNTPGTRGWRGRPPPAPPSTGGKHPSPGQIICSSPPHVEHKLSPMRTPGQQATLAIPRCMHSLQLLPVWLYRRRDFNGQNTIHNAVTHDEGHDRIIILVKGSPIL